MNKFTFNNKEEYLAYRSDWKAEYKKHSQHIRDFKFASWYIKLGDKRKTESGDKRLEEIRKKYKTDYFLGSGLRLKATSMLVELKLAKGEAQHQYLANKELVNV